MSGAQLLAAANDDDENKRELESSIVDSSFVALVVQKSAELRLLFLNGAGLSAGSQRNDVVVDTLCTTCTTTTTTTRSLSLFPFIFSEIFSLLEVHGGEKDEKRTGASRARGGELLRRRDERA